MNRYITIALLIIAFSANVIAQNYVENAEVYTGKADVTAAVRVTLKNGFRAVAGSDVHVYIDPSSSYTAINYNPSSGGAPGNVSPSSSKNYTRTTVMREAISSVSGINLKRRTESVAYFDGLGRPVQNIAVQASPLKKDIVQAIKYDNFGREEKQYLPYKANSTNGAFDSNPETGSKNFYKYYTTGREAESNPSPWNKTLYESSPLNRIVGMEGPASWQYKPTAVSYYTNTSSSTGSILHWKADGGSFYFSAKQLYVTEYIDEDGNKSREYKDKLGRVVRKETHDGSKWLRTAYVYDDFGRLVIVVPPRAADPGKTELCYYYKYDKRGRMIEKDLPGAGSVYMVYDKRDRLVMLQDAEMDANNQWLATIYDPLNRPVITALINKNVSPSTVESAFSNGVINASYSSSGTYFDYSVSMPYGYGISESTIQTVTYYDDKTYAFINEFTGGSQYDYSGTNLSGFPTSFSSKTTGLVVGSLTRVLEETDNITDELLLTVNYYDEFGRPIRIVADNHLGGRDIVYNEYNFAGEILESVTRHNAVGSGQDVKLTNLFEYDHQGRLLSEKIKVNNGTEITLAANRYNELGELISKYLHGDYGGNNFNQKVDYVYNIRGWLRTMNTVNNLGNDLFALDLRYNNPGSGDGLAASAMYNGNISEMRWDTGLPKGYGFYYDDVNRLKSADYGEGSSFYTNRDWYNTSYTYDDHGNIKTLTRKMNGSTIDNLSYTYPSTTDRLYSVNDASYNSDGYDDNNGVYSYDNNGNLTFDPSKNNTIDYNYLNLPEKVTFDVAGYARYTYDAVGNKKAKVIEFTGNSNAGRTDYSGNFIYENDKLKAIFTSAGRIVPFDNNGNVLYKFEYNLQDHLGNTRVVFGGHDNGRPEVMQTTDYYPFGMVMNQSNTFADGVLSNNFLYNGKELQNDAIGGVKLDWYDYGARFYDPSLGRWHVIDNKAEQMRRFSPYSYAFDNPIRFIDPDGMKPQDPIKNPWVRAAVSKEVSDKAREGNSIGRMGYAKAGLQLTGFKRKVKGSRFVNGEAGGTILKIGGGFEISGSEMKGDISFTGAEGAVAGSIGKFEGNLVTGEIGQISLNISSEDGLNVTGEIADIDSDLNGSVKNVSVNNDGEISYETSSGFVSIGGGINFKNIGKFIKNTVETVKTYISSAAHEMMNPQNSVPEEVKKEMYGPGY